MNDTNPMPDEIDVAIVGAGFSGLGMAVKLMEQTRRTFLVVEKAADVGGTWRENTYPGCACDIPSHLYSFSFAQNPNWSRLYPSQPEIWAYLRGIVAQYGLGPHIRFSRELKAAYWDETAKRWRLSFTDGARLSARYLVSGMGGLHRPALPDIAGLDLFQGPVMHSANWDHSVNFAGKRLAVIGTGASAIQIVPAVAPKVAHLTLFQRTPPWVVPRPDRPIRRIEKWLFRRLPFTQTLFRAAIYWTLEWRAYGFTRRPALLKAAQKIGRRNIEAGIADPGLRAAVTPDYVLGCKRVLLSNDYYSALGSANVTVVSGGAKAVTARGVVGPDGTEHAVDAIVLATGFEATDPLGPIAIEGRNGTKLADAWARGPEAYLGITVAGFPNLFFLMGPNTGLGHNSMIFMIEAQIHYVLAALDAADAGGAIEIDATAQADFNAGIDRRLARTVWQTGGCRSWYQTADGRNPTLWPGFTVGYWLKTRAVRRRDYRLGA